jgi:hypothetical protein
VQVSRASRRPAWYGELPVIAFLLVAYDRIANLADLRVSSAVRRGQDLLGLERAMHIAVERSLDTLVTPHSLLAQALSLYYDFAHGLTTIAVLVTVYLLKPETYRRARSALVLINLVALGTFLALPLAPPRLLPGAGYIDLVASSGTAGAWDSSSSVAQHANEYASMPSLHVAWALWVVFAVFASSSVWLRALAGTHLAVTIADVLLTGNHYLLDAIAGGALAAISWALVPTAWSAARAAWAPCSRYPSVAHATRSS